MVLFRNQITLVLLLFSPGLLLAQESPRTIKVRKSSDLAKAQFDNTELRLLVIDRFGNVRDNPVVSYRLWVKARRKTVSFEGHSNELTPEMIAYLNKQKEAVKIFFTELVVMDQGEHTLRLPDVIDVWFPVCKPAAR